MPLVTVVVPTRNSGRTLQACLTSIRGQTHRDIQLVVVDNASTDGTVDIARQYADAVETRGPERSAQRNYGSSLARGEYILFIDSDMVLSPDVVSKSLEAISGTSTSAVVVPEVTVGDGFWAKCRALERSCYANDDLVEAARFFRRDEFERTGGFDESLNAAEDWDLTLRVSNGKSLPRASSTIVHDEGRLELAKWLAKKHYYGLSLRAYWRKHGGRALLQANTVFRPAFVRNWRRLLRHPLLASGVLILKVLETLAGLIGVGASFFSRRQSRNIPSNVRGPQAGQGTARKQETD